MVKCIVLGSTQWKGCEQLILMKHMTSFNDALI